LKPEGYWLGLVLVLGPGVLVLEVLHLGLLSYSPITAFEYKSSRRRCDSDIVNRIKLTLQYSSSSWWPGTTSGGRRLQ